MIQGAGPNLSVGNNLNNLVRDSLEDATPQILGLMVSDKKFLTKSI